MSLIKLNINLSLETTRTANPDDEFDRDDLKYSSEIESAELLNDHDEQFNVYSDDEYLTINRFNQTDNIYVVVVEYTTGDSFHHESGNISVVGAFESEDDANGLKDKIIQNYYDEKYGKIKKENAIIKYKYHNDLYTYEVYTSLWKGYFEYLTDVYVKNIPLIIKQ